MKPLCAKLIMICALAMLGGTPALASEDEPFFRGKTITILVGAGPGGGYDLNTRIFARHFGKSIAGAPSIVVQNMAGAGGLTLANFIFNVAPKDGTSLGVFAASAALEPVFGNPAARFDTRKFQWIGSLVRDTPSCGVWNGAGKGIKSLDDLVKANGEVLFGSTSPSATTSQHALLLKNLLGAPVRVIYGYKGTNDVKLALERGELHATCGMLQSTVKSTFLREYESGVLDILVQFGPERREPFFKEAVRIHEIAKTDEDRLVLDIIFKQAELARPMAAPPETPAQHVATLRTAMLASMKDPDLIADAAKIKVEFAPVPGEETSEIFASYYAIPKELIARSLMLTGLK